MSNDKIMFDSSGIGLVMPLELIWNPQPDITAYELAKCIPIIHSFNIMPHQIDESQPFMRHFIIHNHNKKQP